MIKVGFTIIAGKTKWMGGINYLRNLLYAISQLQNTEIQPILIVGEKIDEKFLDQFKGLAIIYREPLFDRMSFSWLLDMALRDTLGINPLVNRIVRKYQLDVFSHSHIYGRDLHCKTINWIPDFQHTRLPHMFKLLNRTVRSFRLHRMIRWSDHIILSSYDALNDYKSFAPKFIDKASVIHFVSQAITVSDKPLDYLASKYGFNGKYFYLPNQFWVHKNHMVAFKAILHARKQVPDILLICSGEMNDTRDDKYVKLLLSFIQMNNLEKNILLLGIIPFQDVMLFMHHSLAVINPSLFEGWSSTVEEAKSMGKFMILSDISAHKEQINSGVSFFQREVPEELAELLSTYWTKFGDIFVNESLVSGKELLPIRTLRFANEFLDIVKKVSKF